MNDLVEVRRKRMGWHECPDCGDEVYATKAKLCKYCYNKQYRLRKEKHE